MVPFHLYRQEIRPIKGKDRLIHVPGPELRAKHKILIKLLRSHMTGPEGAFICGGVPGYSRFHNAWYHFQTNARYYLLLDLKDAYPNTRVWPLAVWLSKVTSGERPTSWWLNFLNWYCFVEEGYNLGQGFPASPYLFNLYMRSIDIRLGEFCRQRGIRYSRYIDDLTFSSHEPLDPSVRRDIANIIVGNKYRMVVHSDKAQLLHHPSHDVTITGLMYRKDRSIGLPLATLKRLEALLYLIKRGRVSQNQLAGSMSDFIQITRLQEKEGLVPTQRELAIERSWREWQERI